MRLETKVIQVANNTATIDQKNKLMAIWGWYVLSTQITDQKIVKYGDSTDGGENWKGEHIVNTEVITEHTNYATITYQRDLDDPRMGKLAVLEMRYNACDTTNFLNAEEMKEKDELNIVLKNKGTGKRDAWITLIAALVCLMISGENPIFMILFIGALVVSIYLWWKVISNRNYKDAENRLAALNTKQKNAREQRKSEIYSEALSL